jgi:hypothetical protein
MRLIAELELDRSHVFSRRPQLEGRFTPVCNTVCSHTRIMKGAKNITKTRKKARLKRNPTFLGPAS